MPSESEYQNLFFRFLMDLEEIVSDYSSDERDKDVSYLRRRLVNEGLSFLTVTMPALGKAIDASFQTGHLVTPTHFRCGRDTSYPSFLRVLFRHVYNEDGSLLANACPEAVGHLRQACFLFYKLEDDYKPEVEQEAIDAFCSVDSELENLDFGSSELRGVLILARKMIEKVFREFDPLDITPRPGPGASASGTPKYLRWEMLTKWDQVHQVYPVYEFFYVNRKHLADRVSAFKQAKRDVMPVSKMRLVPKDSRGPRIICMEEQEVMFLQQGLADKMRRRMEAHPITRGFVNFTDQTVNQRLARDASCIEELSFSKATLDMKEASDRVSRELVVALFSGLPQLLRALLSLSTRAIRLPSGDVFATRKYAPMGSSLCFPVMSIVHFALGRAIIEKHGHRSCTALADCKLYVYGDDIIVDSVHAPALFEWFPKFGLKFNIGKSFVSGPFRESCGYDAFKGMNVSPQRVKKRFFNSSTPQYLTAALSVEGLLYERGYRRMSQYMRVLLEDRLGREIPQVITGSQVMGWQRNDPRDVQADMLNRRYDPDHQAWYVRARVITTEPTLSMMGCWERLMRVLTGTSQGSQKLAGPYDTQRIAWRWVPVQALYTRAPKIRGIPC